MKDESTAMNEEIQRTSCRVGIAHHLHKLNKVSRDALAPGFFLPGIRVLTYPGSPGTDEAIHGRSRYTSQAPFRNEQNEISPSGVQAAKLSEPA